MPDYSKRHFYKITVCKDTNTKRLLCWKHYSPTLLHRKWQTIEDPSDKYMNNHKCFTMPVYQLYKMKMGDGKIGILIWNEDYSWNSKEQLDARARILATGKTECH